MPSNPLHFTDEDTEVKRRPGSSNTMAESRREFRAPLLHCETQRFQLEDTHAAV